MKKNYKIITIILITVLCFALTLPKKTNAYSSETKINISSTDINKIKAIKYIGHRGIGGFAPENTLPSFELAGKLGLWGAECDVRTTIDGKWMILHDNTVDRMTNGTGDIKNFSLEKLQLLTINSGKNINQYKGLKVPKLEDYLLTCRKWGLTSVIEMKAADNLKYYDRFLEILKKYGNVDKIIVISFSRKSLNELRKRNGNLTLGLLCDDISETNINYVKTLSHAFIDCSYFKITKSKVDLCHMNNIKVGVWTIDDIALAKGIIEDGVDYLTTNKLVP